MQHTTIDNDSRTTDGRPGKFESYEKPRLIELFASSDIVRGGSDYDLGSNRYFIDDEGKPIEDKTEE